MTEALNGQVALVTGGSRGIGRAISIELARQGIAVAVCCVRNKDAADQVVAEIREGGGKAESFQADQTVPAEVDAMVDQVVESLGPVRILVNNAGTTADRTLRRMSLEEWHSVIDTNINGLFHVTSKVWPIIGDAGGGHVICVSSVVGETGRVGLVNYGTSKAAVIGFVRAAAREGARYGIHVNAVAPGFIETDMISGLNEKQREGLMAETVLGRLGRPEEVASMVRYLVTEGTYITGQVFNVNGGMFIG